MKAKVDLPKAFSVRDEHELLPLQHVLGRMNPKLKVRIAASTAATTDAHPFTAHAQGIKLDPLFSNQANPKGNGIPIIIPIGAKLNPITIALWIKVQPRATS